MRVLIVNTSEKTGGAAVAANRLVAALWQHGVKAKMLVRDKTTDDIRVAQLPNPRAGRLRFLWERARIWAATRFGRAHLFDIDTAWAGADITRTAEFREADVIHLAWVNQGMLSLRGIGKILASGKPVVWTMHDLWPAAAICHYARGCAAFTTGCHHCPLLPHGGGRRDLAARTWARKRKLYAEGTIHFVACSRWLEGQAKRAALLAGQRVVAIPNPIDTRVYHPRPRAEARLAARLPAEGRLILFVAQRATDERKGMPWLIEAARRVAEAWPEGEAKPEVAVMGSHAEEVVAQMPLQAHALGYLAADRDIANVYAAADVFVSPSLEDNLPNTIMEALASGTPAVAFRVGGIPEMIDHKKTGWLAAPKDADDLAQGILWALREADTEAVQEAAQHKVTTCWSEQAVAVKYTEVYNHALALKRFHL